MSIADRISSMASNLSSAYGRIAYLGVDTSSIDKNMQNLSTVLDTVYNDYPKVSDEGISPSLSGTKVGRLSSTLKGNTSQYTTTGKQLFNANDIGIQRTATVIVSKKNIITVTSTDANSNGGGLWNVPVTQGQEITISYGDMMASSTSSNHSVRYRFSDHPYNSSTDTWDWGTTIDRTSKTVTVMATEQYLLLMIRTANGGTNIISDLMVRPASVIDDTWEPYTGGVVSPTPNFSQDINVIKEENEVATYSKNWLPPFATDTQKDVTVSQSGTTVTINGLSTGSASISKTYFTLPAGMYRFTTKYKSGTIDGPIQLFIDDALTTNRVAGILFQSTDYTDNKSVGISLSQTTNVYYRVYVGGSNRTYDNFKFDMQITRGTMTDYNFAEYQPVGIFPVTLPTGMELCKIGDYQDKLFKAVIGDTIYDSLTSEQKEGLISGGWYKYAEVGKDTLTGADTSAYTWRKSTTTDMDRFICDYGTRNKYVEQYANSLCNYFTTVTSSTQYAIGNWRNNATYQFVFNFSEYGTTTLEQWKTWLSTHNVVLYQPLITPTITQITDVTLISQLNALYNAMSYNGQTNILQTNADLPFIISASALKGE